jgi:hypothetical protein
MGRSGVAIGETRADGGETHAASAANVRMIAVHVLRNRFRVFGMMIPFCYKSSDAIALRIMLSITNRMIGEMSRPPMLGMKRLIGRRKTSAAL